MDCRLLLTRPVPISKRHVVGCLDISTFMACAERNYYNDEEGFRLTIPILLLPPGRSLFSAWSKRVLLLLIYCVYSLFSIQKLFLKRSLFWAQQDLVRHLQRWRA